MAAAAPEGVLAENRPVAHREARQHSAPPHYCVRHPAAAADPGDFGCHVLACVARDRDADRTPGPPKCQQIRGAEFPPAEAARPSQQGHPAERQVARPALPQRRANQNSAQHLRRVHCGVALAPWARQEELQVQVSGLPAQAPACRSQSPPPQEAARWQRMAPRQPQSAQVRQRWSAASWQFVFLAIESQGEWEFRPVQWPPASFRRQPSWLRRLRRLARRLAVQRSLRGLLGDEAPERPRLSLRSSKEIPPGH